MTARRRLVKLGTAAGAAAAALAILAGPQASASSGETVLGYDNGGFAISGVTHQQFAAQCGDLFSGPVTSDDGNGNVSAKIDKFSISGCNQGVSVTANALPYTLTLKEGHSFTIQGFDVNITTSQGTCRYTGTVQGGPEFPPTTYALTGTLSRQSAGCGGDAQIHLSDPLQTIGTRSS